VDRRRADPAGLDRRRLHPAALGQLAASQAAPRHNYEAGMLLDRARLPEGTHPMNPLIRRLGLAAGTASALVLLPLAATAPSASAQSVLTTKNWAGYIVTAPAGRHVGIVSAYWTLPQARPAHSLGKPPYQAAMWVGIDGDSAFGQKYGPFQAGVYETTPAKNKAPEY